MATVLRFKEHEEFQRAALHMGVAGVLAGLGAFVAIELYPRLASEGTAWIVALLVAAAAFGAARPETRTKPRDLAILATVTAALAGILTVVRGELFTGSWGLAAVAVAFGALLARSGSRRAAVLVASAVAAVLCCTVLARFDLAAASVGMPLWITAGLTGGAFTFVGVLGLLPRHVDLGHDRVADAYHHNKGKLGGEVRELADRAMATWTRVEGSLERTSPERRAIEDAVVRLFDVARRWADVEAEGARASDSSADALAARMEAITEKMTRTEDPIAKNQYAQAHAALAEQVRYLKEIGTARERVIARMHHYLAAMERLRFAVLNHRSADASRLSSEVQPILDDLKDLGSEIDFSNEALGEVEVSAEKDH